MSYRFAITIELKFDSYVTAEDDRHFSKLRDGMVMVQVTHSNLKQHNVLDLRIDLGQSVGELKRKLQTFNGTNPSMMDVVVFNGDAVVRTAQVTSRITTRRASLSHRFAN